jgi:hypothetical protein
MNGITVEDNHDDEEPSLSIWQNEPKENDLDSHEEDKEEENTGDSEEINEGNHDEDMEDIEDSEDSEDIEVIEEQAIGTTGAITHFKTSNEKTNDKQKPTTSWPAEFRLGHRRTIVANMKAKTVHPKSKKK